jgi:DNA-binding XRE family transcriptional regulator
MKAKRLALHLFQDDIAHLLSVDRVSVQNWERNAGTPSPSQTPAIIQFFPLLWLSRAFCTSITNRDDVLLADTPSLNCANRKQNANEISDIFLGCNNLPFRCD